VTAAILRASKRTFSSVLKHRNYRLFFTGQVISNTGTWMQRVAQAWLVLSLTHSPVAVGILALCQFMPFTLFSLMAGVVVDRLDSWRTVIGTQATQMVLASVIAVVALAGVAQAWHVYVIAALMGVVQVLDAPSRQSLTFRMVGPAELPNAISLNSGLFNGARIFGPALAGVLIATVGTGICFAANAASYIAVLAGLLMMRPQEFHAVERRERPRTLLVGLK
jgi:predicted MFS family arabinose efflux permease